MALTTRSAYPLAHSAPTSSYAENYRTIRANIDLVNANIRSILVTSSRPGEGKTSTAANLAIVEAQLGKRVLLIDTDLRHPQMAERFHLNSSIGLTTVMQQKSELQEAVISTEVPGLHILPSGPINSDSPTFLSSLAFSSLVTKLRSKYDLLIFDTPPVLSVSDALLISRNVDGIVFVVDAKTTNRVVAQRALAAIQKVNGKVLGGVVNRIPKGSNDGYYYYGSASQESSTPLR